MRCIKRYFVFQTLLTKYATPSDSLTTSDYAARHDNNDYAAPDDNGDYAAPHDNNDYVAPPGNNDYAHRITIVIMRHRMSLLLLLIILSQADKCSYLFTKPIQCPLNVYSYR